MLKYHNNRFIQLYDQKSDYKNRSRTDFYPHIILTIFPYKHLNDFIKLFRCLYGKIVLILEVDIYNYLYIKGNYQFIYKRKQKRYFKIQNQLPINSLKNKISA